jgi:hypothetical protein
MRDAAFLAGLGLVGWGCWAYSRPLAGVVVGGLLVVLVVFDVVVGGRQKVDK